MLNELKIKDEKEQKKNNKKIIWKLVFFDTEILLPFIWKNLLGVE